MKSPLTTLCYIEKDGAYLMLHRVKKQNDINKDKWIAVGGQTLVRKSGELVDTKGKPIGKRRADNIERQEKHKEHYAEKYGQSSVFSR